MRPVAMYSCPLSVSYSAIVEYRSSRRSGMCRLIHREHIRYPHGMFGTESFKAPAGSMGIDFSPLYKIASFNSYPAPLFGVITTSRLIEGETDLIPIPPIPIGVFRTRRIQRPAIQALSDGFDKVIIRLVGLAQLKRSDPASSGIPERLLEKAHDTTA